MEYDPKNAFGNQKLIDELAKQAREEHIKKCKDCKGLGEITEPCEECDGLGCEECGDEGICNITDCHCAYEKI
jgi:hypothetical protein